MFGVWKKWTHPGLPTSTGISTWLQREGVCLFVFHWRNDIMVEAMHLFELYT